MAGATRSIGLLTLGVVLLGCSKGSEAPVAEGGKASPAAATASTGGNPAGSPQVAGAAGESPEVVVSRFLEALRNGDKEAVAGLLTTAAREETVRLGYHINPPGDPSSKYEVGRVEIVPGQNEAYASSIWTSDPGDGQPISFEAVWVLKREGADWRVSGLALKDPQTEQPLVFDFEKLEEVFQMKAQIEQAADEQDAATRSAQGVGQESNPTNVLQ